MFGAEVAAVATDTSFLIAAVGTAGAMFTAWVSSKATRNRTEIAELRADMVVARERADEAADLVHKLDGQLHQVRVQLTHYQIGTLRLIDQLTHHGVDPVWRPTPETT